MPTSATLRERAALRDPTTLSVYVRESTRVPSAAGSVDSAVAFTVKVNEPGAVGVPEMMPSFDKVSPVGSEPELSSQVTSDLIPFPSSVTEYGEPTAPEFTASVVIPHRLAQASNVNRPSALLLSQSLTASQTGNVPASVAIPSTSAVWLLSWLSFRPGGNAPDKIS